MQNCKDEILQYWAFHYYVINFFPILYLCSIAAIFVFTYRFLKNYSYTNYLTPL